MTNGDKDKDFLSTSFDLAKATGGAGGPFNKIPGILPLDNDTVLTEEEHFLLEKCLLGFKIELIMDPKTGLKKDYSVQEGTTVWELRYMLADGKEDAARRNGIGLPTKNPDQTPDVLDDELVLNKKEHSKLRL